MLSKRISITLLFVSLLCQFGYTQEEFRYFDKHSGLDASTIFGISEDVNGLLILATEMGPFQFNGKSFTKLNSDENDIPMDVYQNSDGSIFMPLTDGNGLFLQRDSLQKVICPNQNQRILGYQESANGDKTYITNRGVYTSHHESFNTDYDCTSDHIIDKVTQWKDQLFLIQDNELCILTKSNDSISVNHINWPNEDFTPLKILANEHGRFLITDYNGIFKITENNSAFSFLQMSQQVEGVVVDAQIDDQNIWLIRESGNLYRYDLKKHKYHETSIMAGNINPELSCLYIDKQHNAWFGTNRLGLGLKVYSPLRKLTSFHENQERPIDLINIHNQYFIATNKSLKIYTRNEELKDFSLTATLDISNITALATDGTSLYLGLDNNGGVVKLLGNKTIPLKGLFDFRKVNSLGYRDGKLYIASATQGLTIYNTINQEVEKNLTTENGLKSNDIEKIFIDSQGDIWTMSNPIGIQRIDSDYLETVEGLGLQISEKATNMIEDRYGNIYLSVLGHGLFHVIDDRLNQLSLHAEKDLEIEYMATDVNGNLWLAQRNQFVQISLPSLVIDSFPKERMIFSDVLSGMGMKNLNNGELFFITDQYIYMMDENLPKISSETSPMSVKKIRLGAKEYALNSAIQVESGSYDLELIYHATCLHDPSSIKYKYSIEEINGGKYHQSPNGIIYFNNVSSGEYTIHLNATNCNGEWNSDELVFKIVIDTPYYEKNWFIMLTIVLIATVLFLIFWIRERQNKKLRTYLQYKIDQRTSELKEKSEELTFINNEMNSSIDYALNIQRSMISSKNSLTLDVQDAYVFYSPKETLSGDFYWRTNIDEKVVIVCGDCTGHGVPGALVSMLCMSELDKTVNGEGVTNPGEILTLVDKHLIKMLKSNEDFSANDGMDASVIIIDKKENNLQFAGASLPCFLQRGTEIEEVKGSRSHVGGSTSMDKEFKTHDYSLDSVNRVFLFSDGVVDQFGGPKGKKFMKKQAREIVYLQATHSLQHQCSELIDKLKDWIGEDEQTDDIVFIGVEF